jgi:membrane-associated phospholipid phosphatase
MASRLRSPQAALLGALLCAFATAAVVSLVYLVPSVQRLDAIALHGFNTLEGGLLRRPTYAIAFFGAPLAFVPGLPLLLWAGRRWGRKREALVGIAVVLASSATAEALKLLITTERFQPVLGPHQVKAGSFPSGTVAAVMAFVVAALIVVPDRLRVRTAIAGAVAVAAVAISVMVNLWHFPSDVLGGILAPTGFGFLGIAALRYMRLPRAARSARLTNRRPAARPSRTIVEAGAAAILVGALVALLVAGERVARYTYHYPTTVVTALAISAAAVTLLMLFGLAAADDS